MTIDVEFRTINENVVNVLFIHSIPGYGGVKSDGGMINKLTDNSVTWEGRTIKNLEQILSKMKELQG